MQLKDTDGKQSKTLFFVTAGFIVVMLKFMFAGLTLPWIGQIPFMSTSEFAIGFAAVMAVWQGREWRQTHYSSQQRDDDLDP